jgi:hypothetical protein
MITAFTNQVSGQPGLAHTDAIVAEWSVSASRLARRRRFNTAS